MDIFPKYDLWISWLNHIRWYFDFIRTELHSGRRWCGVCSSFSCCSMEWLVENLYINGRHLAVEALLTLSNHCIICCSAIFIGISDFSFPLFFEYLSSSFVLDFCPMMVIFRCGLDHLDTIHYIYKWVWVWCK